MKQPVYSTFIDFGVRNAQHRCRGSPPRFFIDDAIRESLAKEALLWARVQKRAARITRKWRKLAATAWNVREEQNVREAREEAGERIDSLTPKLRVTLRSYLFVQYAAKVFEDQKDVLLLCAMGVSRERTRPSSSGAPTTVFVTIRCRRCCKKPRGCTRSTTTTRSSCGRRAARHKRPGLEGETGAVTTRVRPNSCSPL